jgi:hypothetical protein
MGIIVFSIAAILSMPKQFITVYLGVILEQSDIGQTNTKSQIISDVVLVVTFLITGLAMWYILRQVAKAKPIVIYERRKARQVKLERANMPYGFASVADSSSSVFNPRASESEIPLTAQQWDKEGNAVGYTIQPQLHSPQPKRAISTRVINSQSGGRYPLDPRDEEEAAYDPVLPNLHAREDSADLVGWDMYHTPAVHDSQLNSTQYPKKSSGPSSPPRKIRESSSPPGLYPPLSVSPYSNFDEPETPTQSKAQFATYSSDPETRLPTPPYPSPFDDSRAAGPSRPQTATPQYPGHALEGSDSSYTTAHSRTGTQGSPSPNFQSDLR